MQLGRGGPGAAAHTPLPKERHLSPCASRGAGCPRLRWLDGDALDNSRALWRAIARPRAWARAFVRACMRGGHVWPLKCVARRYIDGLEDDGQYMVPSTPADESSGNSLFDFGSAHGTPLSKSTGEPVRPDASSTPLFTHAYMPICAFACVLRRQVFLLTPACYGAGPRTSAPGLLEEDGHLGEAFPQRNLPV